MTFTRPSFDHLYGRLTRLALELDDLALEVGAADLSLGQAETMDLPAGGVGRALEALRDVLLRADWLDRRAQRISVAIDRELLAARGRRPTQGGGSMRKSSRAPAIGRSFPASGPERDRAFWRMSPGERIALMRAGSLTLAECCRWAARTPDEVPLVDGEFEFIAAFSADAE